MAMLLVICRLWLSQQETLVGRPSTYRARTPTSWSRDTLSCIYGALWWICARRRNGCPSQDGFVHKRRTLGSVTPTLLTLECRDA